MIKIINLTVTGTCITKHEQSHIWPSPESNHSNKKTSLPCTYNNTEASFTILCESLVCSFTAMSSFNCIIFALYIMYSWLQHYLHYKFY